MKRYAVFAWDSYYPLGGLANFEKSFDDILDAQDFVQNLIKDAHCPYDFVEIFDMNDYE